nr:MAG TPA: hypothetical protein [Bacteriophage sp.]
MNLVWNKPPYTYFMYSRYGIPLHYGYTLLQLRGLKVGIQIL